MNQAALITPKGWNQVEQLESPYIILDSTALQDGPLMNNLKRNYHLINHPRHGFNILSAQEADAVNQNTNKRKLAEIWNEDQGANHNEQKKEDDEEKQEDGEDEPQNEEDQPNEDDQNVDLNISSQHQQNKEDEPQNKEHQPNEDDQNVDLNISSQDQTQQQQQAHHEVDLNYNDQNLDYDPEVSQSPEIQDSSPQFTITDLASLKSETKVKSDKKVTFKEGTVDSLVCVGDKPEDGTFIFKKESKRRAAKRRRIGGVQHPEYDYVSDKSSGLPSLFICDVQKIKTLDS